MSRAGNELESEFESEFEDEFEGEGEFEAEYEDEDEAFLGALGGIARTVGGLLGGGAGEGEWEDEWEGEGEFEAEYEDEDEAFLGALGGIARTVGGLLGEGEDEAEAEWEDEDEAEEFFKGVGRFFKRNKWLGTLAKVAGPLVATAIGGPAAGALVRTVTSQLEGEGELEEELEDMATAPLPGPQAFGEYLAAQAASAESESEAEALAGVAAYVSLSAQDRQALERMLPALLRGAAVVTRLLHSDSRTRPAIRMVPGIVDGAGRVLRRRLAAGEPVGPVEVGQIMGATTGRVLGGGAAGDAVLRRHARGLAHARRHRTADVPRRAWRGGPRRYSSWPMDRRSGLGTGTRAGRGAPRQAPISTVRRAPMRTVRAGAGPVPRPRPGFVRVVTPVRVPPSAGRPARTVRMVSDVRVPRGTVAAGRPVSVAAPRRTR